MQCTICRYWQHCHCHGFENAEDPRIPKFHFCYICLLGPDEEETLDKLTVLARQRRGVGLFMQSGSMDAPAVTDALGQSSLLCGASY